MSSNAPKNKSPCPLCEMHVARGQAQFHHMKKHEREGLCAVVPGSSFTALGSFIDPRSRGVSYPLTDAGKAKAKAVAEQREVERANAKAAAAALRVRLGY